MKLVTRTIVKSLTASSVLFFSQIAFGGGWSSGGGEILEHAQNPWFIDVGQTPRAKPIAYCLQVAEDFPVTKRRLEALVKQVFYWWDSQFSDAHYPDNDIHTEQGSQNQVLRVVTSNQLRDDCANVDLKFQFGHLDDNQRTKFDEYNVNLKRYVGLTIRTDYSNELRGKGFIYISNDRGPNAFEGHNILEKAWTEHDYQHSRLKQLLIHELGHVFGLQHSDHNESIMSAKFAENLVTKESGYWSSDVMANSVFFPSPERLSRKFCLDAGNNYENSREFFGVPEDSPCFRIHFDINQIVVYHGNSAGFESWQELGRGKFDPYAKRFKQLVTVWLPPEQTVFPGLSWPSSLLGPASLEIQTTSMYKNHLTQESRPMFIQASPRFFQIGGVVGNKIVPDILPKFGEYTNLSGWQYQ